MPEISWTSIIVALIGVASTITALVLGRSKAKVELVGAKDDQTAKWRDSALMLSEKILQRDAECRQHSNDLNDCREARKRCSVCSDGKKKRQGG